MESLWQKIKTFWSAGVQEAISFGISSLRFNDGTTINLDRDEIVVIVGPNNVGKTATLREILHKLKGRGTTILLELCTFRAGDVDQLTAWLNRYYTVDQQYNRYRPHDGGIGIQPRDLADEWKKTDALGDLTGFLCRFVSTEKRLASSKPAANLDVLTEPCEEPVQALVADKTLERQLSEASSQAFGIPLFVDRWSGKKVGIRCGEAPKDEQWSMEFLKEVRNQPPLESQGDGIRSFVGCMLEGVLTPDPVVLLDEPEAFLHPQHARVLGRMLAAVKPANRQLFIATHSLHLLLGLLDSSYSPLRIVRIRRDGDSNPIRELAYDQIKQFWEDPLLRASNVLEGVFHDRVVVCESDGDCRFYSCILDAVAGENPSMFRPDVMFTSCGGKNRMHVVIRALKALEVSVQAIVDFDVLEHEHDLRSMVEAYGQRWNDFEPDWKHVNYALSKVAPPLSLAQIRSSVTELLQKAKGPYLDEGTRTALIDSLRTASPWAAAKRGGKSSIPSGESTSAYTSLTNKLRRIGIFIVECGELERFAPSVGSHGPAWVNEVLRKNLVNDPELEAARTFVRNITGLASELSAPSRQVNVVERTTNT